MPAAIPEGTPVPVRLVQDDTRKIPPTTVPRDRAGTANSYVLTIGKLPDQLLAHTPKRCVAQVIVNATTGAVIAFGGSQSDCQNAANVATGEFIGEVAYTVGPYGSPIPITATDELWAVLVTAGSGPTVVSVLKEVDI